MRQLLQTIAIVVPLALGGCGWLTGENGYFRDRSDEYRKARSIPPMQIPEGKNKEAIQPLFAIPGGQTDVLLGDKFEVPKPTPLVGDQNENVVRIQKLGDEQWLLLDAAPSETWPRIHSFMLTNHIEIESEDAASGLMETAWLSFKSDETKREKYRFRVEQGVQRNSTEVYVQQLGYTKKEGEEPPAPNWEPKSMDLERESWMARQLAGYLADTSEDSSASLLAQGISTVNKVYLIRDAANNPAIDLRLPFERAWASLGRALERAEFNVKDLDRSSGVYFVKYEPGTVEKDKDGNVIEKDEDDGKGFFSGLFIWWGDDEDENPVAGNVYRIEMHDAGEGVTINVRRDDGKQFEDGEAEFVLGVIKAHLA